MATLDPMDSYALTACWRLVPFDCGKQLAAGWNSIDCMLLLGARHVAVDDLVTDLFRNQAKGCALVEESN